jgi:hypothetical protein
MRLEELRVRRTQLSEADGRGSTREQAARAAVRSNLARERAVEAYERVISAHLSAAVAHTRAADLYEDRAQECQGDPAWLLGRSDHHRRSSLVEKALAEEARQAMLARPANDPSLLGAGEVP